MKSKIRKISMFALIAGLLVTLAGRNIINAEEDIKEEAIEEKSEEKNEINEIEKAEDVKVDETSETVTDKESPVTTTAMTRSGGLVPDVTTLGEAFPDANFRKYVAETVLGLSTYDENTVLNATNITAISTRGGILVSTQNISSLEGIEYFTDLTVLSCQFNQINELDLTSLTKLKILNCYNNSMSTLNISGLTELTGIQCYGNQLEVLDVSSATKLTTLHCSNNKISVLDVANLEDLTSLDCYDNEIEVLDVKKLVNLTKLNAYNNKISVLETTNLINLTALHCATNPVSVVDVTNMPNLTLLSVANTNVQTLNVSPAAKSKIVTLRYDFSNVESLDLNGYTVLKTLSATKATGGSLNALTYGYFSGDRESSATDLVIRIQGTAGFMSWDSTVGYYVIAPSMGVTYAMGAFYTDDAGNSQMAISTYLSLSEGGLMDRAGYIIVGADASNVDPSTGAVSLPSGGKYITGDTVYEFDENTTITDTVITTDGNITVGKNTAEVNEITGAVDVTIGGNETGVKVPAGKDATLDINTGNISLPEGSVVTNNAGDEIYPTGEATVDSDGNVTSDDVIIIVPSDKTGDVTTDGSEITFPAGVVVDDGTTSITYPGNIIYDTDDNTVKYLPVDGLFNEDGTLKDSVTQEDITNSKDFVDSLDDSALKTELQDKVNEAQKELDERNAQIAVDDLFDKDGNIKDTVTQDDIDNAQDLVDKVKDADKKKELQDKLDEAQKQLDEKNFVVLEAFKVFTGTGTVYTKIDAPVEKFTKLYVDGKELDTSNYEVTSGSTVITLNETYLKTLANGTYDVDVEFSSGAVVETKLTVNVSNNPSTKPTEPTNPSTPPTSKPSVKPSVDGGSGVTNSSVKAGDETNIALLFGMLVASFAVVGFYTRRKREVK